MLLRAFLGLVGAAYALQYVLRIGMLVGSIAGNFEGSSVRESDVAVFASMQLVCMSLIYPTANFLVYMVLAVQTPKMARIPVNEIAIVKGPSG